MVLAKPQPFNGTRGPAANVLALVPVIKTSVYRSFNQFPTDSSKVDFAVSFMTDYTATWSQPYLMRVFNAKGVVFDKFLNDFRCSFFDHNHQHSGEVALQSLGHELKENVQLAVVMSNIEFTSLWTMQAMALKAGQTIEGIRNGQSTPIPPTSSSAPTTNPNAMDLSAFQRGGPHNRLSNAKCDCRLQLKLCFLCGQARHFSCGCSNRNRKSQ
ncbi:uncharacterized protein VP01_7182g1, partial [Puccinia sorghi]